MALHTELPIYRTGVQLLAFAVKVQKTFPREAHMGALKTLGEHWIAEATKATGEQRG